MQVETLFIDPPLSALASAYAYYNSCLVFAPCAIVIQVCFILIAHRVNILSGWQVPAAAAVAAVAAAAASMMCRLCLWLWGQSQAAASQFINR